MCTHALTTIAIHVCTLILCLPLSCNKNILLRCTALIERCISINTTVADQEKYAQTVLEDGQRAAAPPAEAALEDALLTAQALNQHFLLERHRYIIVCSVSVPTCHTPSATASTLRSVAAPGSSLGGFRGTLRNARPSILPDLPRVLHGCHLWRCHSCPDTG